MSTTVSTSTGVSREKTAVLVITTHGKMEVYASKTGILQPVLTPKPINMNVVLLQAAACGVVNIVEPNQLESYVKVINDTVEASEFNDNTTNEEMMQIAESIRTKLMQIDNEAEEVAQEVYSMNPNYVDDTEVMDYHYHNNKFYNIYNNRFIIDKRFLRANELTNPLSKDWKINLLSENDEDLMETMKRNVSSLRNSSQRKKNSVLYMSEIIQELQKRGILNVLIFDFTCSVIYNAVTPRDIRHVRRSFMNRTKKATPKAKAKAKIKKMSTRRTRSTSTSLL
jgi:hypothetical protein